MIIWKIPGIFLLVIKLIIIKKGGFWMDLDRLLVHDVMMAMINHTFQARSIVLKVVWGRGRLIRILLKSKKNRNFENQENPNPMGRGGLPLPITLIH